MKRLHLFIVLSSFVFLVNCSGSSSSDSDSDSDSGTVSSDALSTLSSIPDINMDSMDSTSSTTDSSLSSLMKASTRPTERSFSRAACEVRSAVEEIKDQVKGFRAELCIDKAFETAGLVTVGNGAYNYYEVIIDESMFADELEDEMEEGGFEQDDLGEETAYVRVGLINDMLNVSLCEIDDDDGQGAGTYTQTLEMTYTVVSGRFHGRLIDLLGSDGFQITIDADDITTSFDDGEAVEVGMAFNGQWGAGTINFNADKASSVITNELDFSWRSGSESSEWGTWESTGYALSDHREGCGTYESSGTYKGDVAGNMLAEAELTALGLTASDYLCWKEVENPDTATWPTDFVQEADADGMCSYTSGSTNNVECFWYDLTDAGALDYMVLSDTSTSPYVADVTAKSTFLSFQEPTLSFVETWDCTAPSGFTNIVVADHPALIASLTDCIALELESETSREIESCEDSENQDGAEEGAGRDFGEEGEGQSQEEQQQQ